MLRKVILPVAVIFSCGSYICLTASCFTVVGDDARRPEKRELYFLAEVIFYPVKLYCYRSCVCLSASIITARNNRTLRPPKLD